MNNRYDQISPVPPMTQAIKIIVFLCVGLYFFDFALIHIKEFYLNEYLGLVPARIKLNLWLWQFVTYIFMHGHPLHLLLNMLILWYFGAELEQRLGTKQFVFFFFLAGVGAGLFNYGINVLFNDPAKSLNPIVGASGAIYGILAAYALFFGNRYFLVFFVFPMKAKYFVLVMAGIELITGVQSSTQDNVAHFAHIGGMVVGGAYIYLRYINPPGGGGWGGKSKKEMERERLKKQFTLIVNESSQKPKDGPFWN